MTTTETKQAIELILLTLDLGVGLLACLSLGLSALFTTTEK
jgi:hypothetical protein